MRRRILFSKIKCIYTHRHRHREQSRNQPKYSCIDYEYNCMYTQWHIYYYIFTITITNNKPDGGKYNKNRNNLLQYRIYTVLLDRWEIWILQKKFAKEIERKIKGHEINFIERRFALKTWAVIGFECCITYVLLYNTSWANINITSVQFFFFKRVSRTVPTPWSSMMKIDRLMPTST